MLLGTIATPVVLSACDKDSDNITPTTDTTGTGTDTTAGTDFSSCTVAPSETEGPFPTKSSASYMRNNTTDGFELAMKLNVAA